MSGLHARPRSRLDSPAVSQGKWNWNVGTNKAPLQIKVLFYRPNPSSPVRTKQIFLYKLKGHPYWPVQVATVEKDAIHFVYFGSGHVGKVAKTAASDLLPFTDENVKLLKTKSAKLSQAIQLAKESM